MFSFEIDDIKVNILEPKLAQTENEELESLCQYVYLLDTFSRKYNKNLIKLHERSKAINF